MNNLETRRITGEAEIVPTPESFPYINNAIQTVVKHFDATYLQRHEMYARYRRAETFDPREFSLTSIRHFNQLYETCFGNEGYFQHLSSVEQEKAKRQIVTAYVLAEYGHFTQMRESGEAFAVHVLAVAQDLAKEKQSADGIAAGLLHDVYEDSLDNGRPVNLDDISSLFSFLPDHGSVLRRRVDALTKAREGIKSEIFFDSVIRMMNLSIEDPDVLLIKIKDRLHNMRTISSMPAYKQERTAWETIGIFAPIAYFGGFFDEYHELMDLATRVILKDERSEIIAEAESAQRFLYSPNQHSIFSTPNDVFTVKKARESTFHEIASYIEQRLPIPESAKPHGYTTIDLSIPEELAKDSRSFSQVIDKIKDIFLYDYGFEIPEDKQMGLSNAHYQLRSAGGVNYPVTLFFQKERRMYLFNLWKESLFNQQQIHMALESMIREQPLTHEERQGIEDKKTLLRTIKDSLQSTQKEHSIWILGNAFTQPMTVSVADQEGQWQRPVRPNATVVDALLTGYQDWMYVQSFAVNWDPQSMSRYAVALTSADVITVVKGDTLVVRPEWYDGIQQSRMCEDDFLLWLGKYYDSLELSSQQEIRPKIEEIGRKRLEKKTGPILYGIDRICKQATFLYHDKNDILFALGLGRLPGKDFDTLVKAYHELDAHVVGFEQVITDQANSIAAAWKELEQMYWTVIREHYGDEDLQYQLDKVRHTQGFDGSLRIYFMRSFFDDRDPHYEYVKEAFHRLGIEPMPHE